MDLETESYHCWVSNGTVDELNSKSLVVKDISRQKIKR